MRKSIYGGLMLGLVLAAVITFASSITGPDVRPGVIASQAERSAPVVVPTVMPAVEIRHLDAMPSPASETTLNETMIDPHLTEARGAGVIADVRRSDASQGALAVPWCSVT